MAACSCPEGGAVPPASVPPASVPAAPPAAAEPAAVAHGPLRIPAPARLPPPVGGCTDDCRDPGTAMAAFLESTARGDDREVAATFLDTTRLVLDGREPGARWAGLWRDLKSATRKDEIREVVRDLSSWTAGLSPDQVKDALTAGPTTVRSWSTEAEYEFQPPGKPPWTVVLAPRGVEWLIVEVRRGPARKENP